MNILVTGAAGFIGYHLVKKLIDQNYCVFGLDNFNNYYDVNLKYNRVKELGFEEVNLKYNQILTSTKYSNLEFLKLDITDFVKVDELFRDKQFDVVVNLAAQAGVRYSIENPRAYIESNIIGFFNILHCTYLYKIKHLIYASSSSIYGNSKKTPFSVEDKVDFPISMYAATKKGNELMAHVYSHLYDLKTTGLRFFTVYGPWGRPDMAYFSFTKAILNGDPINVYNNGDLYRDFTYIDDIVESIQKLIVTDDVEYFEIDNTTSDKYKLYNIGNSTPVKLLDFIQTIEDELGKVGIKKFIEMQAGDVFETHADVSALEKKIKYKPNTNIKDGIKEFIDWYKLYYKI